MAYSILKDQHERFEILFNDEPAYVRGFRMSPESRESELDVGEWLVFVFAMWSLDDRLAIDDVVSVAKTHGGEVKLSVRPFDLERDFDSWLKEAAIAPLKPLMFVTGSGAERVLNIRGDKTKTPFWFWLGDGKLISQSQGQMTRAEIERFVAAGKGRSPVVE